MTEGDARGLVSDAHPYCYGFFDSGLNRAARLLREADAVVLMGRKQDLIVGYAMPPTIAPDARVIQIDPSAAEIARNRGVNVGIHGDVDAVARQMTEEASRRSWRDLPWLSRLEEERQAQQNDLEELAASQSPMHAIFVHKAVRYHVGPEDIVSYDGGDFCHFGRAYSPALSPKTWWYLPPLGMLGQALPTAIAAKAAYPERRVFMFTGDGAFGFNAMEYDTAVQAQPADCRYHGERLRVGHRSDRSRLGCTASQWQLISCHRRYDQVVRGLGGHGELIEHPDELDSAIERAIRLDRPALLNVRVQNAISPRAQAAINRWMSHTPQPI